MSTLLPELFQTEESAMLHPEREAKRLGECPPAAAMLAVSAHARAALPEFRELAKARGQESTTAGSIIGRLFSSVRERGTDLVLSSEKAYRGTLLGLRHGIGVVMLLEHAAQVEGDSELAERCAAWLARRRELVDAAERELVWFARHPEESQRRAHDPRARAHHIRTA